MNAQKIGKFVAIGFAVVVVVAVAVKALVIPALEPDDENATKSTAFDSSRMEQQARLTETDRSIAAAYADDTLKVAELLEANTWVEQGGATLSFGRGFYVLTEDGGSAQAGKLVLGEPSTDTDAAAGKTTVTRKCPGYSQDGPCLVTVEEVRADGAEAITVSSDAFGSRRVFERSNPAREITVERPDDSLLALMGGADGFDKAARQLGDVVARRYPSANKASWTGKVTLDYASRTLSTSYKLDDHSTSTVKLSMGIGGVDVVVGG